MNVIGYWQLTQRHAATSTSAISPPPTPGPDLSHALVPPAYVPPFLLIPRTAACRCYRPLSNLCTQRLHLLVSIASLF
jgi:hypothetical protein